MTDHKLTHLKELEAESIHIIREVAAEFERPVMLYSVGKDSAVMLHLTMKAFFPGKPLSQWLCAFLINWACTTDSIGRCIKEI